MTEQDKALVEQAIALGHEVAATHGESAQQLIDTLATRLEAQEADNAVLREALELLVDRFDTIDGQPFQNPHDSPWAIARAALGESR